MLIPKFQGKIDSGALVIDDSLGYCQYLIELGRRPDPRVEVVVRPIKKRRSLNENAYYHGVVLKILADFSGHARSEIHDAMKMMFLQYEDNGIKYVKSTTELGTVEMEEYLENIRRWADEVLSCHIPLPNDVEMLS